MLPLQDRVFQEISTREFIKVAARIQATVDLIEQIHGAFQAGGTGAYFRFSWKKNSFCTPERTTEMSISHIVALDMFSYGMPQSIVLWWVVNNYYEFLSSWNLQSSLTEENNFSVSVWSLRLPKSNLERDHRTQKSFMNFLWAMYENKHYFFNMANIDWMLSQSLVNFQIT